MRRRGQALEAVVGDVLVPDGDRRDRRVLRSVPGAAGADYAIRLGGGGGGAAAGYVPLPRQGPILTWRAITETTMPPLESWRLTLGDVELF